MASYYAEHSQTLRSELARAIPLDELRRLHDKRPLLHFSIVAALLAALIGSEFFIVRLAEWYFWLPLAFVAGFAVFDFTVLLHEVVHRAVFERQGSLAYRVLGLCYAIPSGISASQFTKWHLDHHAGLGSYEEDPKRHWLSPKKNARWLKALYFTPALFPIYFRAAAQETKTYPSDLQKRIKLERLATIAFHLSILFATAYFAGWTIAFKTYVVPIFLVFPIAFALNRLGQHYDIDPADPAKWSTLVKSSYFWNPVFLFSNFHLEHHYFPGVPFYNLPKVHRLLRPWYAEHGMRPRGYGELIWNWLVMNRGPHSKWEAAAASPEPAVSQS